jgi:diguanylate cyclase (GGDEF)-like protein
VKGTTREERHILVVDDDEHTRGLLKDLCESSGYKVTVADDGQVGLDRIADSRPDLVLLDLMMPRRDGFSVLRTVRENTTYADLPIILLTAMGDMDGKIKGMELGADDYVTKPFKLVELQTRINSALMVREYRRRLMAAEEELAQLRALDPLTGAGTYSQLKASLDSELARSRRYGRPAAALLFGFDDYQKFRYSMGREGCDKFIASMALEIRTTLRGADRLFRVDSDEFVVLLPETDLAGAKVAADRMNQIVQGIKAEGRAGVVDPRVRFGGAVFPSDKIRSSEDLLREANRSYRALVENAQLVFPVV